MSGTKTTGELVTGNTPQERLASALSLVHRAELQMEPAQFFSVAGPRWCTRNRVRGEHRELQLLAVSDRPNVEKPVIMLDVESGRPVAYYRDGAYRKEFQSSTDARNAYSVLSLDRVQMTSVIQALAEFINYASKQEAAPGLAPGEAAAELQAVAPPTGSYGSDSVVAMLNDFAEEACNIADDVQNDLVLALNRERSPSGVRVKSAFSLVRKRIRALREEKVNAALNV